jgi:hypothetical protein
VPIQILWTHCITEYYFTGVADCFTLIASTVDFNFDRHGWVIKLSIARMLTCIGTNVSPAKEFFAHNLIVTHPLAVLFCVGGQKRGFLKLPLDRGAAEETSFGFKCS